MAKFTQGFFKPYNPSKYMKDPTNIVYRSSWEFIMMRRFDKDPKILRWSSEEIPILYKNPATGGHNRYFPDFYIKRLNEKNEIEEVVIEIKPHYQMVPPTNPNRKNVAEYLINQAKWEAAEKWTKNRGMKFEVLNEHNIGIPQPKKRS